MGHSISTFADCLAEEHAIFAWCWRCDRSVAIDVAGIVAAGRGAESVIGRRWRCTGCGQLGTITLNDRRPRRGFWGQ